MRIQHNIMAMNAYRNYSSNTSALSKNLEKLSSGYKINRAGDDAAGLAISEKMRAQITGLETAQKNAKDGISLIQTAEGALTEVHDMLNRMVELADQSANGTYDDDVDRDNLQKEFDALRSEIDRISQATNFNGINLLDGSQEKRAFNAVGKLLSDFNVDGTFPSGANKAEITMKLSDTPAGETLAADKTTDGQYARPAIKGDVQVKFGSLTAGNELFKVGTKVITGSTTLAALGSMTVGSGSKAVKLKDLFDVKAVNASGVPTAATWGAATTMASFAANKTLTLTAKTAGALGTGITGAFKAATGSKVATTAQISHSTGANEGSATAGRGTAYTIDFDLTKLEGGQKFTLGSKTFAIVTNGSLAKTGTASATGGGTINIYVGADYKAGTGTAAKAAQLKAAEAIRDGINDAFGANFTVSNVPTDVNITRSSGAAKYTVSFFASSAANTDTTNMGAVRVITGTGANRQFITGSTYSQPVDGAAGAGKHATAEYNIDITDLSVGTFITLGTGTGAATLEIVASSVAASTLTANQIKKSDLTASGAKFIAAMERAGYQGGKIAISGAASTAKLTITAAGTAGAVSGAQLANGAGKISISHAPVTAKPASGATAPTIIAGKTTYSDIKNAVIDGSTTVGDVFDIQVKNAAGDWETATGTVAAGASIKFVAKNAGELDSKIMDAFNYDPSSVASVDKANGNDETQASGNAKTKYDLNFNFGKLAGGQTFRIGDEAHGKTFEISLDGIRRATDPSAELINLNGMDLTSADGQKAAMEAIKTAVGNKMTGFEVKDNGANGISVIAKDAGTQNNLGGVSITEGSTATGAISGTYTAANATDAAGHNGTFAQVTYELKLNDLQSGDTLQVGEASIKVVSDDTATLGRNEIRLKDAKDADKLTEAINNASHSSSRVSIDKQKNTITITGTKAGQTASELAAGAGKVSLGTDRDLTVEQGGLTLQIGDTSDDFNQLNVSIKKMDCASLGIDDSKINISNQADAQAAVAKIKAAINSVSSTRGDLGALQNRLEHTTNNLSVMTENIQDAESTIRDVDVAQEMMEYTKNNILVQSAQAMLAQANQLPQGVLQLLQ